MGAKKYCAKCGDHIPAKTDGRITTSFGMKPKSAPRWKYLDRKCLDGFKSYAESETYLQGLFDAEKVARTKGKPIAGGEE